ncbi:MAG: hypothetical protein AAB803_01300 [Patescibacteria group bacterium]
MKKKEKNTVRAMSISELAKEARDVGDKMISVPGEGKNTRKMRELRKRLAVIRTFMREKELVHG